MNSRGYSLSMTASAIALFTLQAQAHAQSVAPATPAAQEGEESSGSDGLEAIVVTARRVEESQQDTPISVSTLLPKSLAQAGILQVDQISKIMPNVLITEQASGLGGTAAFIRGIGANEGLISLESSVATYVDGIYYGRNVGANANIMDVERIEVLRGPQGTLFGRNTTGGAINVVTRQPSDDFHIEAKLGVASFGEFNNRTSIDTGRIGNTGLSAMATYFHRQRNGYVDNPFAPDDGDPGALNVEAVGAKLRGEWGALKATYMFDYSKTTGVPAAFQVRFASANFRSYYANQTIGTPLVISPDYQDTLALEPMRNWAINKGHTLNLELALSDNLTFKSISGYRRLLVDFPTSYTPPGILGPLTGSTTPQPVGHYAQDNFDEFARQYSQEFQINGNIGNLSFVSGLFYYNEYTWADTLARSILVTSPTTARALNTRSVYNARTESYAAFAQASYKPAMFDDRLEITVGARYTKDKKSAEQTSPLVRQDRRSFDNFSYMLSLAYHINDDVMTFAKYTTGYRAGGFNIRATAAGQAFFFPSEKAKAAEVGIKSELFDRHLRFNASLFHTQYDDLQVTTYTNTASGGATGFTNPARAKFKGFDAEIVALPFHNFRITGGIGYTDAKYDNILFPAPGTGVITNYADIARFGYLAKWTSNLALDYTIPDTGIGDFNLRGAMSTRSRRWAHPTNLPSFNPFNDEIVSPAHQIFEARLTWSKIPVPADAEVSLFVENLTNRHVPEVGIDFGALGWAGNRYNIPRRIGVDFRVKL